MSDLIKTNQNGQWELMEKAKWISPEQQKANKKKATAQANNDAFMAANIADKVKPIATEITEEKPKKPSHLTVVKKEDEVEKCVLSKNGQWSIEKL